MRNSKDLDWSKQLISAKLALKRKARQAEIEADCLRESYNKADQIRIGGERVGLFNPGTRRLQLFKTGSPLEIRRLLAAFTAKTAWNLSFPSFHLILLQDTPFGSKGTALTGGIIEVPDKGILLEATMEKEVGNV